MQWTTPGGSVMQWKAKFLRLPRTRKAGRCQRCNGRASQYVVLFENDCVMAWDVFCHKHRVKSPNENEVFMTPRQWKEHSAVLEVMTV